MAHAFLKKMLETEGTRSRLEAAFCLAGGFFLVNSYTVRWVYVDPAFPGLLAAVAAILLGLPLVWHALADLWRGEAEMNELAALSFVASFSTGEYRTAAIIAFFMILAQLIEYRSQLGTRKNIESLMRLAPDRAIKLEDGREMEVKCRDLRKDDLVRVRPGDSIPGDGVILSGASSLNESAITGESLPRDKKTGDAVYGGSINLSGMLEIRITQAAEDTTLSRIKDLITRAKESRTPVMRLIDQYAGWYTPVILMLAAIVLFFTRDINRAISMLIIACPCTILLSAPTALVAALSAAAHVGVIIKNVALLETAGAVNALVFDKTGTLTVGRLNLTGIHPADGESKNELLTLAAAAEFPSRHPAAQAIVAEAKRRGLALPAVTGFQECAGRGVRAVTESGLVLAGKAEWLMGMYRL